MVGWLVRSKGNFLSFFDVLFGIHFNECRDNIYVNVTLWDFSPKFINYLFLFHLVYYFLVAFEEKLWENAFLLSMKIPNQFMKMSNVCLVSFDTQHSLSVCFWHPLHTKLNYISSSSASALMLYCYWLFLPNHASKWQTAWHVLVTFCCCLHNAAFYVSCDFTLCKALALSLSRLCRCVLLK